MQRLTHILVLAAFVFSCGGHWYVLQCVAWINMIHDYSQVVPFPEAVSMTFSGKYPCALCQVIAEKKAASRDQVCSLEKYEKKFFPPVALPVADPMVSVCEYADHPAFLPSRSETPPVPPPRPATA